MTTEFLITSIIVVLMPGTGVLYTVAVGLGRGFRASIFAAIGCTLGIIPAASASIIGLAAIFHASAVAFQIVKLLGVVYLLFMAWSILRDGGTLDVGGETKPQSSAMIAIHGMLINVLNPKLSLFFLAFLPQFVDLAQAPAASSMIVLAAIFMALTFVIFALYGACASYARDYIITRPLIMTWIKRSFAVAFGYLGLRLALADR